MTVCKFWKLLTKKKTKLRKMRQQLKKIANIKLKTTNKNIVSISVSFQILLRVISFHTFI